MPERSQGPRLSSMFPPRNILCRLEAETRDDALAALLRHLAPEVGLSGIDQALKAVIERENQGSTILGDGIAVPHARLDNLSRLVIGVATSPKGFLFPDGRRVRSLFLFLVPKDRPGLYLSALSALASACRDDAIGETLPSFASPQEAWNQLEKCGASLPAYLRVRHIMDPPVAVLGEYDTLERAIDLFVEYGAAELPVADAGGSLVGVVATRQLFRVCLPDYLRWIDDLSPFLNFEPFVEVLRKESKTWLTEVTTAEYVTVDEDAPAIHAAKEITRRGGECAYVVRGGKLTGTVSLLGLMRRILRD